MREIQKIDYAKLVGFATVSDEITGSVDFRADTIGAKLGAKVGEHMGEIQKIDYAKLVGFATVSDEITGSVDFRADTIGAKLGAKVGEHVPAPVEGEDR